jgi:hypothetical protein
MRPENPIQNDEALNRALREWKVEAALPPRFREEVWRRIEHREVPEPAWLAFLRRLSAAFARPSLAVSYVTVLLLAGLLVGYWQVRVARAHLGETMGARYVQMIDPYQRSLH